MKYIFVFLLGTILVPQSSISQMKWESVVQIREGNSSKTKGICFVAIKPDQIVTALHVVAGVKDIQVYSKARGRMVPASIIAVHKRSDLALLQLDEALNLPFVEFSDDSNSIS